jgi:flagellum-specific peptidoglycan hydrolase FlgJ
MANNSLIPYSPPQKNWKEILKSKLNFKINYNYVSVCSFIGVLLLAGSGRFWHDTPVTPTVAVQKTATLITADDVKPYVPDTDDFNVLAKAYIKNYSELAQEQQRKYKIPASITLAQGLIEGKAGTSKLAKGNNNHFGMKCFSRNCKKGHCTNHKDDSHKDFFRKYKNVRESFEAHSQLLSKKSYAKLKQYGNDYRKYAYGLKSCGYATDKTYAEKLIGVIEKYDLHRFDK